MALTASIVAKLEAEHTNALDLGTATLPITRTARAIFADGVGANQANVLWSDTRTLAASATEDLDLAGAALLNAFGVAAVFARLKAIYVKAASANTNDVIVGAGTSGIVGPFASATDALVVKPGGFILLCAPDAAGWPVTATTADILKVANSAAGTGVTYDIVLVGGAS